MSTGISSVEERLDLKKEAHQERERNICLRKRVIEDGGSWKNVVISSVAAATKKERGMILQRGGTKRQNTWSLHTMLKCPLELGDVPNVRTRACWCVEVQRYPDGLDILILAFAASPAADLKWYQYEYSDSISSE